MTREEAEAVLMAAVRMLGDEAIRDGYYQSAYLDAVRAAYRQGVIAELEALPCMDDESEIPRGTIVCGEEYDGRIAKCALCARIAELQEAP